MRNKDLDKWLAENVMGYETAGTHCCLGIWARIAEKDKSSDYFDWHPTESREQAFQVVDKMKEGGWFFILWNDSITNWAAGFDKDISQAEFNSVLEETIPLAISLGAKKAIEGW